MVKLGGQLFARFALDYADHPKVVSLSDTAFRAHVEMILYARRYETDGRIPKRLAESRWGTDSVSELRTNDPTAPSLTELPGGDYLLHGYADMQETREQIEERRQVNRQNGRKGGRPRKTQSVSESLPESATQAGGEKKAETETETELSSAIPDRRPDVDSLCSRLADHIEANGSKRPTIGKAWHDAARLLLDRDERPVAEAERLIDWCQQDEFWRSNILSMPKFRQQYDQLKLKAGPAAKPRPDFGREEWMNYA